MPRPPATRLPSESRRSAARPGFRRLPLSSCWRRHEVTHQPAQQSRGVAHLQHCRPFSSGPRYQRPLYREQALVDCALAATRRPAPQCAVHREKAAQRLLEASATSPSACKLLVAGRMDDDLGITVRTLLCLRSSFSCCLGRHLCVIAASWRPSSKAL